MVKDGVEKFARYFKRKGWFGEDRTDDEGHAEWKLSEGGVKIVVEVATAYAVTKALLPLRLVLSVWATPWFARWTVLPVTRLSSRISGTRKSKTNVRPTAGGTSAGGNGVVPKSLGEKNSIKIKE